MEENKIGRKKEYIYVPVCMFVLTLLVIYAGSRVRGMEEVKIIRNLVFGGLGCGTVLFLMAQCRLMHLYEYDNGEHYNRFFFWYMLSLLLAWGCAYLPSAGWPFMAIFVCLSLFGNTLIGIVAGSMLLYVAVMLSEGSLTVFLLYFICGVAAAGLFRLLDENYKIGVPLTLSALLLLVCETAGIVLFTNEELSVDLFIVPFMNVIISTILLLIILRIFSSVVVYRYRDRYMVINDQEFPLLTELKQFSREEYYHAVHTAYFSGRIAQKLGLDAEAAKTGGYYHRIGRMSGQDNWECVSQICREYKFPPAAVQLLKEYLDKDTPVCGKETAIVIMSDAVVSAILYLFAKDAQAKIEYDPVIDRVFRSKLISGMFKECGITIKEITYMIKVFKEEKLYYDFLR